MKARWSALPFRVQLTVWWSVAFGLLLAVANLAIYAAFERYLQGDLDRKVRTVAATELASSTDGPGIHLHPLPKDQLEAGEFADTFVQILSEDGTVRLASPVLRGLPALVPAAEMQSAFSGHAPLISVTVGDRPGRAAVLHTRVAGQRYVLMVGVFRDDIDAHLSQLALVLLLVWGTGLITTAGLGYWLASRALAPVIGISRRAARIARGDFAARLDPPVRLDEIGEMTRALNDVLERLNGALEGHRRFAADVSHELRTPITAMAGEIDVALMRPRTAVEYRETLQVVRERLSSMTELCEDLMLLVRAQEGAQNIELREVALLPQLQRSVAQLAAAAEARRIQVVVHEMPAITAYADPRLLARVLDNVLGNAVFYNRDGGRVDIRCAEAQGGTDIDTLVLTISDTGTGIPDAEQERVFGRFYRLDRSRASRSGGTGLGLAIAREVLGVLRGSISVAASSSQGTTFEIRLPGRVARPRPASLSQQLAAPRNSTIATEAAEA